MKISKRSLLRSLLHDSSHLVAAVCLSLMPLSNAANAQDAAPEQPVTIGATGESLNGSVDDAANKASEQHDKAADPISAANQQGAMIPVSGANAAGPAQEMVRVVESLLRQKGVNEYVIRQVIPELENTLRNAPAGMNVAMPGYPNATVFSSGVYINESGRPQPIQFQGTDYSVQGGYNPVATRTLAGSNAPHIQTMREFQAPIPAIHAWQPQPDQLASYGLGLMLAMNSDNQLVVIHLLEQSVAAEAGLQLGDVIVSADSLKLDSLDSLDRLRFAVIDAGQESKAIKLQWLHNGVMKEASVMPKLNNISTRQGGACPLPSQPSSTPTGVETQQELLRRLHGQSQVQPGNSGDSGVKRETLSGASQGGVAISELDHSNQVPSENQTAIKALKDEIQDLRNEVRALTEAMKSR